MSVDPNWHVITHPRVGGKQVGLAADLGILRRNSEKDGQNLCCLSTQNPPPCIPMKSRNEVVALALSRLSDCRRLLSGRLGRLSDWRPQLSDFLGQLSGFLGRLSGYLGQLSGNLGRLSGYPGRLSGFLGRLSDFLGQLSVCLRQLPGILPELHRRRWPLSVCRMDQPQFPRVTTAFRRRPRFTIPIPRKRMIMKTLSCLLQLGHLPSKRQDVGLPPPPMTLFFHPYIFRAPSVVKITATKAYERRSVGVTMA